jgi:uncharacterized phage protein (TIGR01671 family)
MTRPIKFRAWDERHKEFHHDTSTHANEVGDVSPWTYEQYTGLKDKNGREIYEGDFLKLSFMNGDDQEAMMEVIDPHSEVWFHRGQFLTRHHGFPVMSWADSDSTRKGTAECEVVGNIHETKAPTK